MKRLAGIIVCGLLLLFLSAACGGGGGDSTPPPANLDGTVRLVGTSNQN